MAILGKGSKLYSILTLTCPRCNEGKLFSDPNPYNLKRLYDMPDKCPVCGQSFNPELGFWWGAMYVSYGLTVGLGVANVLFFWLVLEWSDWYVLLGNAVVLILLIPIVFRYSRGIWFNLFYSYKSPEERAHHDHP